MIDSVTCDVTCMSNMSAGDIAFRFINFLRNMKSISDSDTASDGCATVCDISQAMLDVGKRRAARHGHGQSLVLLTYCQLCVINSITA